MFSLSKSLTNREVYAVFALIAGHGKKYRLALTHPYDAEATTDTSLYKRWLWQQMQKPHCATYKHLAHLVRAHQAGKRIIIQVHQNARHGEIILAALHYLTDHLPPLPKARPKASHGGSAHFQPWSEQDDDLIDERRFVWISSQDIAHLGYIWDTEGLLTALVPGFGLVKLERPGPFWLLRSRGRRISRRIHTATVTLGGDIERTFGSLIRQQQAVEQTDIARQRLPYSGHGLAGSALPYDERYDSWQLHFENGDEETQDFASQQPDPARPLLYPPKQAQQRFHDLLPTAYRGGHVKPVVKTKPDGSRWVLTPEMQARGVLHLYQPI
jgi:hypothetical protein